MGRVNDQDIWNLASKEKPTRKKLASHRRTELENVRLFTVSKNRQDKLARIAPFRIDEYLPLEEARLDVRDRVDMKKRYVMMLVEARWLRVVRLSESPILHKHDHIVAALLLLRSALLLCRSASLCAPQSKATSNLLNPLRST